MKKEYDLSKLKMRKNRTKKSETISRTSISIKLESETLGDLKVEAARLGMPYQTLINSILFRFVSGQLIDKKEIDRNI
jgi:predicted DNA binding CopG/RHH family protein